ncbi:Ig-like domain-containing protein [Kitasatospora sp. NBC_01287]|uniref:L,D-transpeptidase n=1 Tax=Kitasatospora sp. NBC_01287 TaxID=2903573 RepID=UPI002256899A|nr:Ig-like domain-containing protein [Kitasatospora sp. NBC_01287]MCX4746674.1 Ig-like domain-containing protein [Kitasatospora sp. NBC_01287]
MEAVQAADAARGMWATRTAARRGAAALLAGGVLLLASACGPDDTPAKGGSAQGGGGGGASAAAGSSGGSSGGSSAAPKLSAAQLTVAPADGAQDVAPSGAVKVSVANGKLTQVSVADKDGNAVAGSIAADGSSWSPTGSLAVGMLYKVSAQAVDAAGLQAAVDSSFTTLTPAKTISSNDNVSTGSTYGVGMIVSVSFNKPVKNKDAVVQGITFQASDGTTVKGHWFGDQRLDFRPQQYWKAGTKVTIHYKLKSVEVSPGVYGGSDRDESFTVGRSQISTADASSDQMTVVRDGQTIETLPISAGNDQNPSWNGTMTIESKELVTRMNSATVSNVVGGEYDVPDVPHAMRLTDSGTYVHGNYWGSTFGKSNASHGCVGLQDAKGGDGNSVAGKFYASSLVGDVVIIKNSKGKTVSASNGLSGWTLPWGSW